MVSTIVAGSTGAASTFDDLGPAAGQRPGGGSDDDGSDALRQSCCRVVGRLGAGDPPRLGLVGQQHVAAIEHRSDIEGPARIVVGVERRRDTGCPQFVEQTRQLAP